MAELTFRESGRNHNEFDILRPNGRAPIGWIYLCSDGYTFCSGGEEDPAEWVADELDQIAAKLRSLNGEPNTRSTDESDLLGRVRKLYDHTKSKAWSTKSPHYKYAVRIRELFPELFPACKPSEEEVKCIHGVPNSAGYCPRCDEENRSDPA